MACLVMSKYFPESSAISSLIFSQVCLIPNSEFKSVFLKPELCLGLKKKQQILKLNTSRGLRESLCITKKLY